MYRYYHFIPHLFTLGNLFCGCCAVVFFLQSGEMFIPSGIMEERIVFLPEKTWWGCLFIGIAMVLDFADGFVARLLKVPSHLGKELDSLADAVSFGVAPAMILYMLLRMSYMQGFTGIDTNWWLLTPAFTIACAAAYRLAVFNLDTKQTRHFRGMPTPAMAAFVVGLPFCVWFNYYGIKNWLLNKWVLYALIFFLAYLMTHTRLYFFSFKWRKGGLGKNAPILCVGLFFIGAFFWVQWLSLPLTWLLYVLISLLWQGRWQREA